MKTTISPRLAEIAIEKGYESSIPYKLHIYLTYQELFEWIFDVINLKITTPGRRGCNNIDWLEFWYEKIIDEIKDNKFVYGGFYELLSDWFLSKGYHLACYPYRREEWCFGFLNTIGHNYEVSSFTAEPYKLFKIKQEAQNQVILEGFKILKSHG